MLRFSLLVFAVVLSLNATTVLSQLGLGDIAAAVIEGAIGTGDNGEQDEKSAESGTEDYESLAQFEEDEEVEEQKDQQAQEGLAEPKPTAEEDDPSTQEEFQPDEDATQSIS